MATQCPLVAFRTTSEDYEETQQLKSLFAHLREQRRPFHLTSGEFDEILRWKLRTQYYRQFEIRKANTSQLIHEISARAFNIVHWNKNIELRLRIAELLKLRGVGVPVASAVLTLVFPDEYGVIDFRGWRQVFGEDRGSFTVRQYQMYLDVIRHCARRLGWQVQEVDLAIWERDRETGKYDHGHVSTLVSCQASCLLDTRSRT